MSVHSLSLCLHLPLLAASLAFFTPPGQAAQPVFTEDFSKCEPGGALPEGFILFGDEFRVVDDNGNRVLELPGAPLDTFGVIFGDAQREDWGAEAKFTGNGKGRRFPEFAIGINGVAGYRLRLAPAKKAIELVKNEEVRVSQPYTWENGTWTHLRIQIRKTGEKTWKVEGKAWPQGSPEPAQWAISWEETSTPPPGRASVWGLPFSGTPIRFDDLKVWPLAPGE